MKCKYYYLSESDEKAKKHVIANISQGAYEHTFTKKLLVRFSAATGPFILIAMEGLELDRITDYSYAAYYRGHGLHEVLGGQSISVGHWPTDGLVSFLQEYLNADDRALVAIENWISKRTDPCMSPKSRAAHFWSSRIAYFQDEVFHVLTPKDTDPELIEDTIREPWHTWFTGVCAGGISRIASEIWSENVLDELVAKTEHIFVPALDDEGFLIWTPGSDKDLEDL